MYEYNNINRALMPVFDKKGVAIVLAITNLKLCLLLNYQQYFSFDELNDYTILSKRSRHIDRYDSTSCHL